MTSLPITNELQLFIQSIITWTSALIIISGFLHYGAVILSIFKYVVKKVVSYE